MVSARIGSFAAILALAAATPAAAEWWKVRALAGAGSQAAVKAAPARSPVASTPIPEPADFALFAAGVVGLLLGRRGSRSRRDRNDED